MPKAAVDKDGNSIFGQNDIGLPWQIPSMETEAPSRVMQELSYKDFRPRIRRANAPHVLGTKLGRKDVHA